MDPDSGDSNRSSDIETLCCALKILARNDGDTDEAVTLWRHIVEMGERRLNESRRVAESRATPVS